tara:strand:+ start:28 stop:1158 length:1131 start_codon:yes stop_codon:yes gene_type:complete
MPPKSQTSHAPPSGYHYQFPPSIATNANQNGTNYRASINFQPMKVNGATVSSFFGQKDFAEIFEKMEEAATDITKTFFGLGNDTSSLQNQAQAEKAMGRDKIVAPETPKGLEMIVRSDTEDMFGDLEDRQVSLFLPMNIQQIENVTVGPENLGPVGGAVSAAIAGGSGSLVGIASSAFSAGLGGIGDMMAGNVSDEFGSLLANRLVSKLNTSAGLGVTNATRIQVSPNTRSIFKQVNIREWSFTFQMIPTSEEESIEIENIIDFFRMEQLPVELGAAGVSMAYRFPNLMTIDANYISEDGTEIPIITRFLPSYLQAVDVSYNTSGMSFYDNGKYHDATMSLKFIEYRPLNKHDIDLERKKLNKTSPLMPNDLIKEE